jgi:transcriptional regulator with XRE-family HTH domain
LGILDGNDVGTANELQAPIPLDRHTVVAMPGRNPTEAKMTRVTKRTQDIDRHVGARIRERRVMLGLSQHQLADIIGVTYQQEHKYERSINRVSAGRLFEIARGLSVPVNYFFEGFDVQDGPPASKRERMCLEVARNFGQITDEKHQEALCQLTRALAVQQQ